MRLQQYSCYILGEVPPRADTTSRVKTPAGPDCPCAAPGRTGGLVNLFTNVLLSLRRAAHIAGDRASCKRNTARQASRFRLTPEKMRESHRQERLDRLTP
jgi:hypothetical protein